MVACLTPHREDRPMVEGPLKACRSVCLFGSLKNKRKLQWKISKYLATSSTITETNRHCANRITEYTRAQTLVLKVQVPVVVESDRFLKHTPTEVD